MGHAIEGMIAPTEALQECMAHFRHAYIIPLAQGFAFLPLIDDFFDEVSCGEELSASPHPEFWKLSVGVTRLAAKLSERVPVAYVETDYFGGAGCQAAVAWQGGQILLGPLKTNSGEQPLLTGAINQVLRHIGVCRQDTIDEFDALRLWRFRHTEDYLTEVQGE